MVRSTFKQRMFLQFAIAALVVCSSLSWAAAQSAAAKATSALSDIEAQTLMQTVQQGGTLSQQQTQMLMQYLMLANSSSGAGSAMGGAQKQMMLQTLMGLAHGGMGNALAAGGSHSATQSAVSMPNAVAPAGASSAPAAAPLGEKKPGIVRIGIAMPKAQLPQAQGPTAGEPVRVMLIQYLTGPSVEATEIAALLPDQIDAEAKSKQCDYVVYSTVSQKKPSGSSGLFKNMMPLASMVPMVGMVNAVGSASKAATAASAASTAAQTASMSSGIKAKTDVVLEYHMNTLGVDAPVISNTLDTKTSADGEDVITPMVEKEATAIMAEVTKKK